MANSREYILLNKHGDISLFLFYSVICLV